MRQAAAGAAAETEEWEEVMPEGKTKRCQRCKIWRAITQYPFTGEDRTGKRYRRNICNACRVVERRESKTKWKARAYTAKTYKLVHDPSGTFSVGGQFFKGEVNNTLKDGHWTPGMWWIDQETGSKYEVQGNEEWHLLNECLRGGVDVKCQKQRLVRSYGKRQPPYAKPDGVLRRE